MRTRARLATILCLALWTAAPAAAADRDYVLEVWGTERGLPTSFVSAIAQTPDGYLWIATQTGLVRFDGSRFVTFDPTTRRR